MAPENGRNDSKLLYPPKADPGKCARAVFQYYLPSCGDLNPATPVSFVVLNIHL
jgi:hypothetical protein